MIESGLVYKLLGGLASLASAASWAYSTILFLRIGDKASPIGMNLGKCLIGILYMGAMLLIFGVQPISSRSFLFLAFSGLLGIAFGDTFYFKALLFLGARLTILIGTLGSVFTVVLAVIFLKERPPLLAWLGIILTVSGVSWILWEQSPQEETKKKWLPGIIYGLLSVLCMSIGIIFAKIGVVACSALQATSIRIFWSAVGLTLWGGATGKLKDWLLPFKNPHLLKLILFAVFIAIFGGFYLFIVALRYIDASVATVLNSTTPLFILPMAAFMLKEKITSKAVIGACVAVAGLILIFMR